MRYPETVVPLRDGSSLTLRSAGPEDAEAVLAYLEATTAETPYLLREPGESSFSPRTGTAVSAKSGGFAPGPDAAGLL